MNPQKIIDESVPMLEDVLAQIGIAQPGAQLDLAALRIPFSNWLSVEPIPAESQAFLASVIGAFICEYLVQLHGGQRYIDGRKILLRVPIVGVQAQREFDPYAVAWSMATDGGNLDNFLASIST